MNTFGNKLRLTTFGESHGPALGGVIDGFPAGFKIDFDKLQAEVDKRKPGNSPLVTQRKESDTPQFLSGISCDGITLGTPIGFIIKNEDQRSRDYDANAHVYRPNHADFTYNSKYGLRDFRGGGRASARETANWVVAGALASQWLETQGVYIYSELTAVGEKGVSSKIKNSLINNPLDISSFFIPESEREILNEEILKAKENGDSVSGIVSCLITGVPVGTGQPVFHKLHSALAGAMMSINAAKAFEYGVGSDTTLYSGIEQLDIFYTNDERRVLTKTNFSGGIQGGISNGMPIFFNVTFKPTPTVMRELNSIDENGEPAILKMKGRHDPCVAVRAVPVVKAMASLVIADYLL